MMRVAPILKLGLFNNSSDHFEMKGDLKGSLERLEPVVYTTDTFLTKRGYHELLEIILEPMTSITKTQCQFMIVLLTQVELGNKLNKCRLG
jgi:hypothetical protein